MTSSTFSSVSCLFKVCIPYAFSLITQKISGFHFHCGNVLSWERLSFVPFCNFVCVFQDESQILKLRKRDVGKVFVKCSISVKSQNPQPEVRIGVLGASGYTGSEVAFFNLQLIYSLWEEMCLLSNGQSTGILECYDIKRGSLLLFPILLFHPRNDLLCIFLQIVRLLANHPHFGITLMTADRKAGQPFSSVFPHLFTQV